MGHLEVKAARTPIESNLDICAHRYGFEGELEPGLVSLCSYTQTLQAPRLQLTRHSLSATVRTGTAGSVPRYPRSLRYRTGRSVLYLGDSESGKQVLKP